MVHRRPVHLTPNEARISVSGSSHVEFGDFFAALSSRYTVERPAGTGGSAVVFLARDRRLDRSVAIKVLRPEYAEVVGHERFLREIETAARLQHPHIVPIYDSGREEDILYCVMPFIDGESLRERLVRERRIAPATAIRLALEIGDALAYAHSLGVVHRDIKPENILLFRDHAMVADFGIAKMLDAADGPNLTQEGLAIGTPAYMSPEQAFGEATVDGRSDQYSLACVLYEMLEGALPFAGASAMALLASKARGTLATRPFSVDTVPAYVGRTITRALSREPQQRFSAIDAFADALRTDTYSPNGPDERGTIGTTAQTPTHTGLAATGTTRVAVERSIAVLPFTNNSSSADDEFLSDGISEDLIYALSKLRGLRVVARTSAFAFKGKSIDARTLGEMLGVRSLLSGTVRRHGARIRISADLVDTHTGFSVWSERYDRERADVFEVQDEITHAIVSALKVRLLADGPPLVKAPTVDLDAWESYLRGRFQWNQRTGMSLRLSVESLQRAVTLDPDFSLAHAALADAYVTQSIYGLARPDTIMPLALAAATRALQLDPTSAEALTARGSVRALYSNARDDAERDFLAAMESQAQYATTHQWYAMHLLAPQRRFADARAHLTRAYEIDPLSPAIAASLGILRFFERDYEHAQLEYKRVLDQHPAFHFAEYLLGQLYTAMGHFEDAVRELRFAAISSQSSAEVMSALACAEAGAGNVTVARAMLTDLRARAAVDYISPVLIAQVHVALGEPERALDALDAAVVVRATELPMLGVRPAFDALVGQPRFETILRNATGFASTPRL